jgi:hypothetical protein
MVHRYHGRHNRSEERQKRPDREPQEFEHSPGIVSQMRQQLFCWICSSATSCADNRRLSFNFLFCFHVPTFHITRGSALRNDEIVSNRADRSTVDRARNRPNRAREFHESRKARPLLALRTLVLR